MTMANRRIGTAAAPGPQKGPGRIKAYMNWSGGKDSSLCLHRVLQEGDFAVDSLLTSISVFQPGTDPWRGDGAHRVSMHGVRRELVEAQAAAIGIPLETMELPEQPGMPEYEAAMQEKVSLLKTRGCHHALFGDIFLEDLKAYREEKLLHQEVRCVFPLWKIPSRQLMAEFLELGFKAIVICVNGRWLDRSFCGRLIDETFLRDLPENVDPCGENGEYHSFVFDGPIFKHPVAFQKGDVVYKEYKAPRALWPRPSAGEGREREGARDDAPTKFSHHETVAGDGLNFKEPGSRQPTKAPRAAAGAGDGAGDGAGAAAAAGNAGFYFCDLLQPLKL